MVFNLWTKKRKEMTNSIASENRMSCYSLTNLFGIFVPTTVCKAPKWRDRCRQMGVSFKSGSTKWVVGISEEIWSFSVRIDVSQAALLAASLIILWFCQQAANEFWENRPMLIRSTNENGVCWPFWTRPPNNVAMYKLNCLPSFVIIQYEAHHCGKSYLIEHNSDEILLFHAFYFYLT